MKFWGKIKDVLLTERNINGIMGNSGSSKGKESKDLPADTTECFSKVIFFLKRCIPILKSCNWSLYYQWQGRTFISSQHTTCCIAVFWFFWGFFLACYYAIVQKHVGKIENKTKTIALSNLLNIGVSQPPPLGKFSGHFLSNVEKQILAC